MQLSKAAQVPEELFEHIIWHACDVDGDVPLTRDTKLCVSSCATVCKYWARLARHELFGYITLRTLDDVHQFCDILHAPTLSGLEPVSEIVHTLNAIADRRDMPWLHLVFLVLVSKLRKSLSVVVKTLPADGRTWPTLHPSLPRPLPGSTMPLETLNLTGVHFPTARVLIRLISSIPNLFELVASDLTFDTKPASIDLNIPPYGRKIYHVKTNDHQLCLAFIPVLVANSAMERPEARLRGGRVAKYTLGEQDLATLCGLFGLFEKAPSFEISCMRRARFVDTPKTDLLDLRCYGNDSSTEYSLRVAPDVVVSLSPWGNRDALPLDSVTDLTLGLPTTLHVHTIHINLTSDISDDALAICSEPTWTRFAEMVCLFPHLQHFEVIRNWGRLSAGREHASLGITDAALEPLIKSKKLRCRFLDWTWRTVHLQADTVNPKIAGRSDRESDGGDGQEGE